MRTVTAGRYLYLYLYNAVGALERTAIARELAGFIWAVGQVVERPAA